MDLMNCGFAKDSFVSFLNERTSTESIGSGACILTVPVGTIDGRLVDVYIESRMGDYAYVHDGGKAANEMILQGVDITPSIENSCGRIAQSFGVIWSDETFQMTCKQANMNSAILGVAMASSLATVHLLSHQPNISSEPVHDQVGQALRSWNKRRAAVQENVLVTGELKQHKFDFIILPKKSPAIAVSILSPSGNPIVSAERFAFKFQDLARTKSHSDWRNVAVQTQAENWSGPASTLISKCAKVVKIDSTEKPTKDSLAPVLDMLLA